MSGAADMRRWVDTAERCIEMQREQNPGNENEEDLGDCLANLMHWAAARRVSFDDALAQAQKHFTVERAEFGGGL